MSPGGGLVLAVLSSAGAVTLLIRPRPRRSRRLRARLTAAPRGRPRRAQLPDDEESPGASEARRQRTRRRAVLALAVLALVGSAGPVAGSAIGLAAAVAADRFLDRLEPASRRRRRQILLEDLPVFADLLAATTRAGVPTARAVSVCAVAVGGPLGRSAARVATALELGAEPARAWELLAADVETAPLAATMIRSGLRGLPPTPGLRACAAQARRTRAAAAASRAQTVAVSAAAPLGLCFLPAFVLLAVVPTVAGGLAALLG